VWGNWLGMAVCPIGTYVCGLRDRFENAIGTGGDDTAMNGIRMKCCNRVPGGGNTVREISAGDGIWGSWKNFIDCPANFYACGLQTRFEPFQGTKKSEDDTALNGVRMRCCDRGTYSNQVGISIQEGAWGNWKPSYSMCPTGQVICGLESRFESDQGVNADDTAMNGIKMRCCDNSDAEIEIYVEEGLFGGWKGSFVSCPANTIPVGMSVRNDPTVAGNGDATALNGIRLRCQSIASPSSVTSVSVEEGLWGNWGSNVQCPADSYVCGFNTQFLGNQGLGDDSALNGIAIRCCNFRNNPQTSTDRIVLGGLRGSWKSSYVQCPTGYYAHGYQTRFQSNQVGGDDTALNGLRVICRKINSIITYPSAAPSPAPTIAPTSQYGLTPISPLITVFVPRQLCTPDNCPQDLGTCLYNQCIFKNGYNGMRTMPKAYATISGCSLANNNCDGVAKNIFSVSNVVTDMVTRLPGSLAACPGSTSFSGECIGVAGVNPSLFGDAPGYAIYQKSWGLGLSPASGMCYKLTGYNNNVAYLAVVNRCSGMCSCPSRGFPNPVNCGNCIGTNYFTDLIPDIKPNCQCMGTASNSISTCATPQTMAACDWCAANKHPHFNIDTAAFQHVCGPLTLGRCEIMKVEVVPNCVTKNPYW
jgi:hypothetical protein